MLHVSTPRRADWQNHESPNRRRAPIR
ncbi:MAG: hypothetical protein QOJ71_135, partial [Actinomycetota bacterium]|nr:hypothetical protein [Actinomycetota bacterium]